GHCYGLSVLSLALFQHVVTPLAAGPTFSLGIADNLPLQHEIAYAMSMQTLESVNDRRVAGSPVQVLNALTRALANPAGQTYTLAIFRPDGTGGHAITPFAVVDNGGGHVSVLAYDNNFPGQVRTVSFDTVRNTWQYQAST